MIRLVLKESKAEHKARAYNV